MTCISCSVKLMFLISNVCKLKLIYKNVRLFLSFFCCNNKGYLEGTQLSVSGEEDVHCTDSQMFQDYS